MPVRVFLSVILSTALASPALAQFAPNPVTPVQQGWRDADNCAKDSWKEFPDFTKEANASREAYRLTCLRNHGLPTPDPAGDGSQKP